MRYEAKNSGAPTASKPMIERPGWLEAPWHYVSIGYRSRHFGLLVETGDKEEERREAKSLCGRFVAQAKFCG